MYAMLNDDAVSVIGGLLEVVSELEKFGSNEMDGVLCDGLVGVESMLSSEGDEEVEVDGPQWDGV